MDTIKLNSEEARRLLDNILKNAVSLLAAATELSINMIGDMKDNLTFIGDIRADLSPWRRQIDAIGKMIAEITSDNYSSTKSIINNLVKSRTADVDKRYLAPENAANFANEPMTWKDLRTDTVTVHIGRADRKYARYVRGELLEIIGKAKKVTRTPDGDLLRNIKNKQLVKC